MRLTRVKITNFRSIADETVHLDPPCRVLVGVNESGKTNILRALSMLDPEIHPGVNDIRDAVPGDAEDAESRVVFVFAVTPEERAEVLQELKGETVGDVDEAILVRNGKRMSLSNVVMNWSEILLIVRTKDGQRSFSRWADPNSKILGQWHRPAKGTATNLEWGGETRSLKDFTVIGPTQSTAFSPGDLTPHTTDTLLALIVEKFEEVVELPGVMLWQYEEENLLPGSIPLAEFSADPDICLPLKHMFMLARHEDVSEAIAIAQKKTNGLRNLLEGVGGAATKHVSKIWKEFKGLSIELSQNGSNIEATIKDAYNRFDLARRSDGCKRFVSFLLTISAQERTKNLVNTLYLHDEPDTSLHPSGARYLRDELIRLSESNYVVYSTHSIFMIDRENLGRHLIVEKHDETTTLKGVTASNIVDEEVVYNALGYSIFEQLSEKNILFEGWRDKRLFQVRMGKLPTSVANRATLKNAGVCHVKGVSDVGRVTPMLELARRQWIIVSDADDPARAQQRTYDGVGPWFRYDELGASPGSVTSEDFVEWSAFEAILGGIASENPGLQVPIDWAPIPGVGKVAKFRHWFKAGGMTQEVAKVALERIKEAVFKNLKPAQICDEYTKVVAGIGKKLQDLKSSVPGLAQRQ
jgi:AAA ATPase domain